MPSPVRAVLIISQVCFLVISTVFLVIAVRGYRGTPFGAVLRPLPIATVVFSASSAMRLVPLAPATVRTAQFGINAVAVAFLCLFGVRLGLLLTGRREVTA